MQLLYVYSILRIIVLAALIYGYILFIRVAKRAIRALDLYIKQHSDPKDLQ